VSDVRPFFRHEAHENSGKLYESAVLGKKAILYSPDLYHIRSSVTGVLLVILLVREAPSDPTFSTIMALPIAFEASAFLAPLLHFFF